MVTGISCTTSGESHGPAEVCIVEGVPAGLPLTAEEIDVQLQRRQRGYGRGGRMAIETDHVEILSGVRAGTTLGTPVTLLVEMLTTAIGFRRCRPLLVQRRQSRGVPLVTVPRPGHADYAGSASTTIRTSETFWNGPSPRDVSRVAGGAVARPSSALWGRGARQGGCRGWSGGSTPVDLCNPQTLNWAAVEASDAGGGCRGGAGYDRRIDAPERRGVARWRVGGLGLGVGAGSGRLCTRQSRMTAACWVGG